MKVTTCLKFCAFAVVVVQIHQKPRKLFFSKYCEFLSNNKTDPYDITGYIFDSGLKTHNLNVYLQFIYCFQSKVLIGSLLE